MIDDDVLRSALDVSMTAFEKLASGDLGATVASCPGWSLHDLVTHVGNVHRTATAFLRAERSERVERPRRLEITGLPAEWYSEQADALRAELDRGDLDDTVATWIGRRPRRWWLRRQTHELLVHRWDAERALGEPGPLDPSLSADAIDETFEVFVPAMAQRDRHFTPSSGTLHVHCTDTDGEWLIDLSTYPVEWERAHAKGDLAMRGPAGALLLTLWGRNTRDAIELLGDAAVLDQWRAGFQI